MRSSSVSWSSRSRGSSHLNVGFMSLGFIAASDGAISFYPRALRRTGAAGALSWDRIAHRIAAREEHGGKETHHGRGPVEARAPGATDALARRRAGVRIGHFLRHGRERG